MGNDLLAQCVWQIRPAAHAINQSICLASIEPAKGLHGYRWEINPGKLYVRPQRDHQQQSHMLDLLDDAGQQFKCGWVCPV